MSIGTGEGLMILFPKISKGDQDPRYHCDSQTQQHFFGVTTRHKDLQEFDRHHQDDHAAELALEIVEAGSQHPLGRTDLADEQVIQADCEDQERRGDQENIHDLDEPDGDGRICPEG
jgi:hypothetical protein